VSASDGLASFGRDYAVRALDDAPVTPVPFIDRLTDEDESELAARIERLSYEASIDSWAPIPCEGEPAQPPARFIDGSIRSRTALSLDVGGVQRPAILAAIGALALCKNGRQLFRPAEQLRLETVLCLLSNDMPEDDLEALAQGLADLDIRLVPAHTDDLSVDFEVLRRRTFDLAKQRMEAAERDVLFLEPDVPTAIDGLLERRLTSSASQTMPVVGVVKRQLRQYLPETHIAFLYGLEPGQRSPAFILETQHAQIITWYLRLSGETSASPSYGIVRLTTPRERLEAQFSDAKARSAEISALSKHLYELRHRERSYARAGISLEPIVRVEDELHAVMPSVDRMLATLHRALGV
jgi:hypothetical protein